MYGTAGTSINSAPAKRIISFFSLLCVSGITITVLKPIEAPTKAKPIPVLPAVPSTIVPPGFNLPEFIAFFIILNAALSFTDCPGFKNSALPKIIQPVSSLACLNFIKGVFPIAEARLEAYCIY